MEMTQTDELDYYRFPQPRVNLQWWLVPGYFTDETLTAGPPCGAGVW